MSLPIFNGWNILVVGDIMVDHYIYGHVSGKSPEAPVPVLTKRKDHYSPGGAANVGMNIHSLGSKVWLAGLTGDDEEGYWLRQILQKHGISTHAVMIDPSRPTTLKTRIIDGNKHLLRIDRESSQDLQEDLARAFIGTIETTLKQTAINVIAIQDYNKGLFTDYSIPRILDLGEKYSIPIVVDPKYKHFFSYQNAEVVKPNKREIEAALNKEISVEELLQSPYLDNIRSKLKCACLMVTLSESGIVYNTALGTVYFPSFPRDIKDVSGAGDTVLSIIACLTAAGSHYKEIATWANLAGGLVCEESGVQPIDPIRLKEEYAERVKSF